MKIVAKELDTGFAFEAVVIKEDNINMRIAALE